MEKWEHVNVEGILPNPSNTVKEFPLPMYETTAEQITEILKPEKLKNNGKLSLRGKFETQTEDGSIDSDNCNSQLMELY